MGDGRHSLSFGVLRQANLARQSLLPNANGETHHSGTDWTINDWMTALVGEVGEAANLCKKLRRHDFTLDAGRPRIAQELADVAIYLDLLANACGIDLGDAIRDTWNAKSQALGVPIHLDNDGWYHTDDGINVPTGHSPVHPITK